jgi:hypothetical protein
MGTAQSRGWSCARSSQAARMVSACWGDRSGRVASDRASTAATGADTPSTMPGEGRVASRWAMSRAPTRWSSGRAEARRPTGQSRLLGVRGMPSRAERESTRRRVSKASVYSRNPRPPGGQPVAGAGVKGAEVVDAEGGRNEQSRGFDPGGRTPACQSHRGGAAYVLDGIAQAPQDLVFVGVGEGGVVPGGPPGRGLGRDGLGLRGRWEGARVGGGDNGRGRIVRGGARDARGGYVRGRGPRDRTGGPAGGERGGEEEGEPGGVLHVQHSTTGGRPKGGRQRGDAARSETQAV